MELGPPEIKKKDIKQEELTNKINSILSVDFNNLNKEEFQKIYISLQEEPPVLKEEEIEKILRHVLGQFPKDFNKESYDINIGFKKNFLWAILDYISNFKEKDKKSNENTLDRSFRTLFSLAEEYPVGVYESMSRTHHMFEYVKPEVFYDTLIKIQNNEELNNLYSGHLFSQLEYNISYCGTEKYTDALIKKIDFKNSKSCSESSSLMNFAVNLADYANSGSYSGSYDVGNKITDALRNGSEDQDSIYLLASKAKYILDRMKKGWPPLVHQNSIFEPTKNTLAKFEGNTLYIGEMNDELKQEYEAYQEITQKRDSPPENLAKAAAARGDNYVQWEVPRWLIDLQRESITDIKKQLRPINPQDLAPTLNIKISPEEIKEYSFLVGSDFRIFIEEDFGISLSKLSLKEQFYLFKYFQDQTQISINKVKQFSKSYNESGLKTFFSLAYGGKEIGDKILEIGEKLPEGTTRMIFTKYGEIIDVADKAEEEIKKLYEKENVSPKVLSSVKEHLLKKGAEMLSSLADKENINEIEILRELENIKTETMILGSSYLELYKSGEKISFDEVIGTSVEKISAQNITEEKKEEIIKAYINGRPKETYENEEHLKLLVDEFRNDLNKKETNVFNIRFNGEIIAFADFQKIDEDTFHIGGLTFLEDVRNSAIAVAVMNSIMKEFGKYNIIAEVHSKNKILNMYQKRFRFKIMEEMPLEENAGELYYKIERPKDIKLEEKQEFEIAA